MTLEQAINHLEEELKNKQDWSCVACKEEHEQLLEWLKELQAIKSAEPSDAMECIKRMWDDIDVYNDFRQDFKGLKTIENYILKAQEQEKILKSIKGKVIWVENDKLMCGRYADTEIELEEEDFENKEEFNTLKEMVNNG